MGRSEELGTGLRNVFKYSKAYSGSEKVIFLEEDIFMVKVPLLSNIPDNVNVPDNVPDNVPNNVPDNTPKQRMELLLDIMAQNKMVLIQELSKRLKVSKRTIRRDIEKLKQINKLRRIGSEKNGYWEIL